MAIEEFRVSVKIKATQVHVWSQLIDWKSQSNWMALTKVRSTVDNGGTSGIGTDIKAFTGIGKVGILDEMRIVTWEPPHFCAVDHYGRWIKGIGEFRLVKISDDMTRFDWYEKIQASKLLLALIKPGILIAVLYSLRKFARSITTS